MGPARAVFLVVAVCATGCASHNAKVCEALSATIAAEMKTEATLSPLQAGPHRVYATQLRATAEAIRTLDIRDKNLRAAVKVYQDTLLPLADAHIQAAAGLEARASGRDEDAASALTTAGASLIMRGQVLANARPAIAELCAPPTRAD